MQVVCEGIQMLLHPAVIAGRVSGRAGVVSRVSNRAVCLGSGHR
jgi:hypothetical protein